MRAAQDGPHTTEAIMARIEVYYRPAHFNHGAFALIPPGYRAALLDGGRPDRLPTHDGETADEAVRLLCASHGLDPSRVEIVRR